MWTIRGSICNIIRNCSDIYLKKLDSCDSGDLFFSWLFQYHYQLSAAQFSGRKHVNHAVLFAIGYRVVHEKCLVPSSNFIQVKWWSVEKS